MWPARSEPGPRLPGGWRAGLPLLGGQTLPLPSSNAPSRGSGGGGSHGGSGGGSCPLFRLLLLLLLLLLLGAFGFLPRRGSGRRTLAKERVQLRRRWGPGSERGLGRKPAWPGLARAPPVGGASPQPLPPGRRSPRPDTARALRLPPPGRRGGQRWPRRAPPVRPGARQPLSAASFWAATRWGLSGGQVLPIRVRVRVSWA